MPTPFQQQILVALRRAGLITTMVPTSTEGNYSIIECRTGSRTVNVGLFNDGSILFGARPTTDDLSPITNFVRDIQA